VWQHHFGKGLVKTTTDFGRAGVAPSNPALLDWLGARFINSGWSIKELHKTIMLSSAYQMSSRAENELAVKVDPANELLWRQNLRRLEAETIRDSILAISGQLQYEMGGRGFFPHLAGEVLAGASRPGLDWQKNAAAPQSRRTIYTYIRRTMMVPVLEAFDYSNTASPLGERPVTTVAPQALMLLNDDFMQQQAAAFAQTLLESRRSDENSLIRSAYQQALARPPTAAEMKVARDFLARQTAAFSKISSRRTFRPDVPVSFSVDYMNQLKPDDFLTGPREGWTYYRGHWSQAYEGIRTVDRQRGPFALWTEHFFENGAIDVTLMFDRASDFGSILLRANAVGDEQRGYEFCFDPRQQKISLRRHTVQGIEPISEVEAAIPVSKPLSARIELTGSRVKVSLGGKAPVLDLIDRKPIREPGYVGIRTWGAPMNVDTLAVVDSDEQLRTDALPSSKNMTTTEDARVRALQSFCLLLFNLNELIYVD